MLHHQDDLSRLPPGLAADVAEVLASAGRGPAAPAGYEVLSSRVSVVARVPLREGDAVPASVVVKHVPAELYGAEHRDRWRAEFLEEAAAYAFLARDDVAFAERPGFLGLHPNGVLVLDDLGSEPPPMLPLDEVAPLLAGVLARLHAATLGRGDALRADRVHAGLPADGPDERYDGTTSTARRRTQGAAMLALWAQSLGVAQPETVQALLAPAVAAIDTPGRWHACIHDDVANHRQCPIRDGRMLLLDFENARYAHALLDVAKVLVGKFERDLDHGDMVYMCPGFAPALADDYRRALVTAGGPSVDDEAWATALADAVVCTLLVQLGHLVELAARTTVRGGLLANLGALLDRLDVVLGEPGPRAELRHLLRGLAARVSFGRALSSAPPREGALL